MDKAIDYMVLARDVHSELSIRVRVYLHAGWSLHGPTAVVNSGPHNTEYSQALVVLAPVELPARSIDPDFSLAIRALAYRFCQYLQGSLGSEAVAEAAERNRQETDPRVCHTHDHCDANIIMNEAWRSIWPHSPPRPESSRDTIVWNMAWDRAKDCGLSADRVLGGLTSDLYTGK